MSGNICRCGAYPNIVAAIQQADGGRRHEQLPICAGRRRGRAVRKIAADPTAKFIAGGTNLIDLMKEDVERPTRLIDISRLPLATIEESGRRSADRRDGAEFRSGVASADRAALSAVVQAILAGASAQLRNMASTGSNSCNARAAFTSTTPRRRATSASLAAAARR